MQKIWMLTASLACLVAAMPQAEAQSSDNGIETVIVTARKVAENAQTVPISITALNAADLEKLNINTAADLQSVTPSLVIQPSTFRQDTLDITIRGQHNFDSPSGGGNTALDFDPSVAVYQDGIYYARTVGLTSQMFDLQSVDVLKGPQGTLVGRNSTGGAIMMESRGPTQDFGGYLKGTFGDYAVYGLQGAVNIPITETLAVRAAFSAQGQRGYIANHFFDPVSGMVNNQPAMGSQKLAGRVAVKWTPDDSFSLLVRGEMSAEHDTGSSYHDLGYFVGTVAASGGKTSICNIAAACAGFTDLLGHPVGAYYLTSTATSVSNVNTSPAAYNSILNSVAREQTKAYGFWSTEQALSNLDVGHYNVVSAVADKKFDNDVDVKWTSGYRWFDSTGTSISRGQPYVSAQYFFNVPSYKSYQSELTVTGNALDSTVKWTGGLFFFEESDPRDGGGQYLFLPSAGPAGPTNTTSHMASTTDQTRNGELNISYAAYAQATWAFRPDTRVTLGGRYTLDQRNAHLDTQKIVWPTTSALTVSPAVFSPGVYTVDGINYTGFSTVCSLTNAAGASLPLASCPQNLSKSFHKPTWTLAIDHDLYENTLIYFTMRSGYRSGAINSGTFNPTATVAAPEDVTDYEAGIKADWTFLDMPVRSNFDGYISAYHNLQSQQNLPNVTLATGPGGVGACTQALFNANQCVTPTNVLNNVTFNVGAARISGFEWDLTALPTPALELNFTGSYLDARYTNYTFTPPAGYLLPAGNTGDLSGTPIPAPRWQMSVSGTYDFGRQHIGDLDLGDASLTAHFYYQSRYLADLALVANGAAQRTSPWATINLQAKLSNFWGLPADFIVYMNNVANQQICTPEFNGTLNSAPNGSFSSPGTSGVLQCIPMAPRETGVSLQYNF